MSPRLVLLCACALLVLAGGFADARSTVAPRGGSASAGEEYEQLAMRLERLVADPVLGRHAAAEIARARASLLQLKDARRRDRAHWAYVVERRIEAARAVAEAEVVEGERESLRRESDRLQLELARRDAAQARAELERQRLQAQIRAEEAEYLRLEAEAARAEGEQAALAVESARAEVAQAKRMANAQARANALKKKEAELEAALGGASAHSAAKRDIAVPDSMFVPNEATFAGGASARFARIVTDVKAAPPGSGIRIEAKAADAGLAERRAAMVRNALVAGGVADKRISVDAKKAKSPSMRIVVEGAAG
jgi:outer membrane protein OmpA-like peptidoglycan-associated protein